MKYKVKFIKDKISGKIKLENEKRENVIAQLIEFKYPKLDISIETPEEKRTYNYITNMQLFSLTLEKITEHENEYQRKQDEYDDYNTITAKELWKRELKEFINIYHKWLIEKEDRNTDDTDITIEKKRNSVKKSKNKK